MKNLNNKQQFIFGLIKEDKGYSAINIADTTYLTCGDTWNQLLDNIQDVIEILKNIPHKQTPENEFSQYCCYILVEYNGKTVNILKKTKKLNELDKYINA